MTRKDRAAIAAYAMRQGAERFRVTRGGEVHIYGIMPDTKHLGWYFEGFADHILDRMEDMTMMTDREKLLSDLGTVSSELADWAVDRMDEGMTPAEVFQALREAVVVAGRE
jgi:hypothetical protein